MVAYGIEYNWQPDVGFARAALADMKLPSSIYEVFFPGAEPLSFEGGTDAWEEKWSAPSSASASALLQRIDEKWASDTRWSKVSAEKSNHDASASTITHWKLTDEEGQVWNGTASVQPVAAEKNHLLITLKITRQSASARAQIN